MSPTKMTHWLFANDFPHIILIIESCLCLSESSVRLSKHDCKMLMQYILKIQLGLVGFPSHRIASKGPLRSDHLKCCIMHVHYTYSGKTTNTNAGCGQSIVFLFYL